MSRRYWIADLHLGHGKIAEMRGFADIAAHDVEVLEPLMRLDADDVVWVLGDISSGKPEREDRALSLLGHVPAQLHLIAGNHDSVSSIHRTGFKKQHEWLQVFDSIQQFGRIKLDGRQIMMSHYPYGRAGDGPGRSGARYLEYRLPDVGLPLIHGHTHQPEPHMRLYGDAVDTHQFCVSWDAHRGLVGEGVILEWIQKAGTDGKH